MNDFTKEELQRLFIALNDTYTKDGQIELKRKIQSKIDNYCECEHTWRCFDDEFNTRECKKCNEKRTGEINE